MNIKKYTISLLFWLLLLLTAFQLKAQDINVSINIIPPYPTKISYYASNPQLMVILVQNKTDLPKKIQLRGSITGDNGISIKATSTYKSKNAIELGEREVLTLNGNDINKFFDYNNLSYTGITANEFVNQNGLPEGVYRFCIQAFDYDTGAPLSAEDPLGCSPPFTVSSLEPPIILNPINGQEITIPVQNFVMRWNTPVSSPPSVRYRIRMVEILGNRNPNDAIMSATQPYFFEVDELMGNAFAYIGDPALTPGRSYAMMVEAYDPEHNAVYRNNGRSEVISFTYNPTLPQQTLAADVPPVANLNVPDCSCKTTVASTTPKNDAVTLQSEIKVNDFKMKLTEVALKEGHLTGKGTIPMPYIGSAPGAKLRVQFTGIDVNANLELIAGTIEGITSQGGMSLLPTADQPDLKKISLTPEQAGDISDFFSSHAEQMVSSIKNSASSVGFELPFGIEKGPMTVGVMKVYFTATQAWFDAVSVMELPDGHTRVALSGRGLCMSSNGLCKDGTLFLASDFTVPGVGLTLKKDEGNNPGTSITFDKDGFKNLHVKATYTFLPGTLVRVSDKTPLEVNLETDTEKGWGDWVASVSFDPFQIGSLSDFTFSLGSGKQIVYDHSDTRNPDGIPSPFTSGDPGDAPIATNLKTWRGFYIPQMDITLPGALQTVAGTGIKVTATKLIFDEGISGNISVGPQLALKDGSLDGWFFSVDNINLKFWKSAFKESSMNGRLMLPPSGSDTTKVQNQLNYSCNLTKPAGQDLSFQFKVEPKDDLSFSALWANLKIAKSSSITISNNNGWNVKATLNGQLKIQTDVKNLPDVQLAYLSFENMVLQSRGTVFVPGEIRTGLGSDNGGNAFRMSQRENPEMYAMNPSGPNLQNDELPNLPAEGGDDNLFGFSIAIKDVDLFMEGTEAGVKFTTKLSLATTNFMPEAEARFKVFAKINPANVGTRKFWEGIGGKVENINLALNATIGPLGVNGSITYYDLSQQLDRGFAGKLSILIPGMDTRFEMKGQFGSKKPNITSKAFNYFYIDALIDFGQTGIVMFPGTALYGFGGGVSYNMKVVEPQAGYAINNADSRKKPDAEYVNGTTSFSGRTYIPEDTNKQSFELQAGVFFGLTNRNTLDADLVLGLRFEDGIMKYFGLTGRGRLLCDPSKEINARHAAAIGKGIFSIELRFDPGTQKTTFDVTSDVALDVDPVTNSTQKGNLLHASGSMAFHVGPDGWYFHLGRPEGSGGKPWDVTILKFAKFTSYFECGSTGIDEIPPVPTWITDLARGNKKYSEGGSTTNVASVSERQSNRNQADLISGKGIITGFTNEININPEFLMFYGKLHLGFGADLSIKDYGPEARPCNNTTGSFGANGWYGVGQAYMGAEAEVGVHVNIFGIDKRISFVEAGAGAIIRVGLPNPSWIQGVVGGHFSVLDGLIKGNFNLKFEVGEVCDPNTNGEGIRLISEMSPANNSKDIEIFARPAVSFNFPINKAFTVKVFDEEVGKYFEETYQIVDKNITLQNNQNNSNINVTNFQEGYESGTAKSLIYKNSAEPLAASANYTFTVSAKAQILRKGLGGVIEDYWTYAKDANGKVFEDKQSVKFTTNCGYKAIPISNIIATLPYHRQQGMPTNALAGFKDGTPAARGMIKMKRPLNANDFCMDNFNITGYYAKLIPEDPNAAVGAAVQVNTSGSTWTFPVSGLAPNTTYFVQIIARDNSSNGNAPAQNNSSTSFTKLAELRTINNSTLLQGNVKLTTVYAVNRQELLKSRLQLKSNERGLLSWFFRTGQYSSYDEKFKALTVKEYVVDGIVVDAGATKQENTAKYNELLKRKDILSIAINYYGPESFNRLDLEDVDRNDIMPKEVSLSSTRWESMFTRQNVAPNTDAALQSFLINEFGVTQVAFDMLNMNASPNITTIYHAAGDRYPTQTNLLPQRLAGVSISDFSAQAAAGQSGGNALPPSSTPPNSTPTIPSGGNQFGNLDLGNVAVNVGAYSSPLFNKNVYTFRIYPTTRPGEGVMVKTNMAINVIRLQTTWLVDPGPEQFEKVGAMMDVVKTATVNQPLPVSKVTKALVGQQIR